MKIHKVINNNVVSAFDEAGQELVVMGRGLAFQKKPGQEVDETKIEKIFTLKDPQTFDNFKLLLREIPAALMSDVEDIIQDAKETLDTELSEKIYLSLPDHIHFAIERYNQGIEIKNGILWEIKQIYKDEFAVGQRAVERINKSFDVQLPEDEAAFVAIHILEASLNENTNQTVNTTKFIQHIINIVKYHFNVEFDEDSLNYGRFITHLKYFAQRVFHGSHYKNDDDYLYIMIKQKHKEASKCTEKIKDFIKKEYDHDLTNEEMLYLTIHIERVVNR
ncbi:PRD domain-containing protein [Oceanobacillus sp. FSL W8-0428]|uniref:BglG family transcription antiterminator LicT n=1 Tax=unclassified Oceanobacillus TaxID=2630292 RepID=UPI0012ECD408